MIDKFKEALAAHRNRPVLQYVGVFLLLLVFKATGIVSLPWWFVLMPLWTLAASIVITFAVLLVEPHLMKRFDDEENEEDDEQDNAQRV